MNKPIFEFDILRNIEGLITVFLLLNFEKPNCKALAFCLGVFAFAMAIFLRATISLLKALL